MLRIAMDNTGSDNFSIENSTKKRQFQWKSAVLTDLGLGSVGPTGVAPHDSPSGRSYTKCPEGKGNLDPTKEDLYTVLGGVLADLKRSILPLGAVHMGGEEVHWGCWQTESINKWAAAMPAPQFSVDPPSHAFESDPGCEISIFHDTQCMRMIFRPILHGMLIPFQSSSGWFLDCFSYKCADGSVVVYYMVYYMVAGTCCTPTSRNDTKSIIFNTKFIIF